MLEAEEEGAQLKAKEGREGMEGCPHGGVQAPGMVEGQLTGLGSGACAIAGATGGTRQVRLGLFGGGGNKKKT